MAQQQSQEISITAAAVQGIKLIRQLRQNITKTFEFIGDGVQNRNETSATPSSSTDITNEQAFSKELKQDLNSVIESFEHLEKLTAHVPQQKGTLATGNLNNLMQNYVSEQNSTYEDALSNYNWVRKVQDYSNFSYRFVSSLVRVNQSTFKKVLPPFNTNVDVGYFSKILPSHLKTFQGMEGTAVQRGRNSVVLLLTINSVSACQQFKSPVLKVAILMRSLNMEWVNVKGPDEEFYDDYGKLDIQSPSRHEVFRKVSSHTKGAMMSLNAQLYFGSGATVLQQVLKQYFSWIHTYRFLFNEPCVTCKQILKDYLPPVCRDIRAFGYQIVHETCK